MFEGLSTALITPFRDDAIDEPALRQLIERQIAAGVDHLVPCGSTGESATLSHVEHGKVIEIAVSAARGLGEESPNDAQPQVGNDPS